MIVEGLIVFIITASLFMVAPGVLAAVREAAPAVNATTNPALAASQTNIAGVVAGGLNLSTIALVMLGVAMLIAGFMILRPSQ